MQWLRASLVKGPLYAPVHFAKRLADQQLTMEISNEAKQHLAKAGYDPQFGARPLKRTVQEQLLNPLATRLLNGEFKPGDNIRIGLANDELTFDS